MCHIPSGKKNNSSKIKELVLLYANVECKDELLQHKTESQQVKWTLECEKNLPRNKTELNKLKDIFYERFMFEKCNK